MNYSKLRIGVIALSLLVLGIATVYSVFDHLRFPRPVGAVPGQLNITAPTGANLFPGGAWTSGGNVGIGTTAPAAKFQMLGDVTQTGGDTAQLMVSGATNQLNRLLLGYDTTNNVGFIGAVTHGTAWRNLSLAALGGNVGIGTTAPVAKLDLGTSGVAQTYSSGGSGWGGSTNTAGFRTAWSSGYGASFEAWDGGAPKWGIYKWNANTPAVVMQGQYNSTDVNLPGNVGIGTTAPGAKLDLKGGNFAIDGSAGYSIYNWTPTDANWRMGMSASPGFTRALATSHVEYATYSNGAGQGFAVGVNGGNSSFEIAGADHTAYFRGNVGIGTTAPGTKLDVSGGDIQTSGFGRFKGWNTGGGSGLGAEIGVTSGEAWVAAINRTNSTWANLNLQGGSSGGTKLTVLTSGAIAMTGGNVGIGTATPGNLLDVNGVSRFAGGSSSNWASMNIGGTNSINTAGNIYSYNKICSQNASGACDGAGGAVINGGGNSFFTGNVGIGTAGPGEKLTVVDAGNSNQLSGTFATYANNLTQGISLGYAGISKVGSNANSDLNLSAKGTGTIYMASPLTVTNGSPAYSGYMSGSGFGTNRPNMYIFDTYDNGAGAGGNMYFQFNGGNNKFVMIWNGSAIAENGPWTTGAVDLAENYKNEEPMESGDIVVASVSTDKNVKKSTRSYQNELIGLVSTKPGLLMGGTRDIDAPGQTDTTLVYPVGTKPIALIGRAPAKVSSLQGSIKKGEPVTSSSIKGIGMKATATGIIVGKALEDFSPTAASCRAVSSIDSISWPADEDGENTAKPCFRLPDGTYVGKIVIYVNATWYDPDIYLTSTGNLKIAGENGNYTLKTNSSLVSRIGAFAEIATAKIRAGLIEAKQLVIDGVDVLKEITELKEKVATQQIEAQRQQRQIEELKATVEKLRAQ